MSPINGIFAKLFSKEHRDSVSGRDLNIVLKAFHENASAADSVVSPMSSMKLSAVFACVRVLSETVASLPLITYERLERGKKRAQDFYLYELLHDRPNGRMTAYDYREAIQSHLVLWGNAYSRIIGLWD